MADLQAKTDPAVFARALNGQTPTMPQATPNVTMAPVAPGNIIHSNDISPNEVVLEITKDPKMQQQGLSGEGALTSVQWVLSFLQTKSLKIEGNTAPGQQQNSQRAAPSQPADLQTINSQAEAEARRKAEDDAE